MSKLVSYLLIVAALLLAAHAHASTGFTLPDPAIFVNPNYGGNTTIVQIAGVTYRGPSQLYYVSECSQADGPRYHCNILAESVVLKDANGNPITVSLTMQDAAILITSGHNQWRQSQIVLSGSVVLP